MTEHALGLRGEAGSTVALGLALTPAVRNRSRLCPIDDTSLPSPSRSGTPAMSSTSKSRATGTSVLECATMLSAIHTTTSS